MALREDAAIMRKYAFPMRVLFYECIAFVVVIALLWVDEFLDLPHYLMGAPATPINWRESVLESLVVLALAAGALVWTYRAIMRIRHLEGFLPVCIFCRRIRDNDRWIPIEEYIEAHSEAEFSHGLCVDCTKEHYPELSR
jgi:hypothetical protein